MHFKILQLLIPNSGRTACSVNEDDPFVTYRVNEFFIVQHGGYTQKPVKSLLECKINSEIPVKGYKTYWRQIFAINGRKMGMF